MRAYQGAEKAVMRDWISETNYIRLASATGDAGNGLIEC